TIREVLVPEGSVVHLGVERGGERAVLGAQRLFERDRERGAPGHLAQDGAYPLLAKPLEEALRRVPRLEVRVRGGVVVQALEAPLERAEAKGVGIRQAPGGRSGVGAVASDLGQPLVEPGGDALPGGRAVEERVR